MQIHSATASDAEAVHRLLSTYGWAHRIGSVDRLGRLISASQQAVIAVADGEIVGFARAICHRNHRLLRRRDELAKALDATDPVSPSVGRKEAMNRFGIGSGCAVNLHACSSRFERR